MTARGAVANLATAPRAHPNAERWKLEAGSRKSYLAPMTSPLVSELLALDAAEPSPEHRRSGHNPTCRNCDAPLTGRYCAQCGQFDAPADPTLREILADAWDAFTSLDGKLATTLRLLLTRPGVPTRDYLAGRRARYLTPLRLYLVCSVAFFFVSAYEEKVRPDGVRGGIVWKEESDSLRADSARADDARDEGSRAARGRAPVARAGTRVSDSVATMAAADDFWRRQKGRIGDRMRAPENRKRLGESFEQNLPKLMFFLVPVYALLLKLAYWRRRWNLPAHLVVALHMHAFFFVVLLVGDLESLLVGKMLSPWTDLAVTAWLAWYGTAMLRGAYGGRWRTTIARAAVVSSLYGTTIVVAMLGLFFALVLLL